MEAHCFQYPLINFLMNYYYTFETHGYQFTFVGDPDGITKLLIHNDNQEVSTDEGWEYSPDLFVDAMKQLEEYFEGKRKNFDLKLNPQGSNYHKKVWNILQSIPYGQLKTYKDIAVMIGDPNASRAVGLANNRNPIPILIPCHRVVGSNGKMMGYAYGVKMKRELIEMENYHSFLLR